jgi:hypothetical protein
MSGWIVIRRAADSKTGKVAEDLGYHKGEPGLIQLLYSICARPVRLTQKTLTDLRQARRRWAALRCKPVKAEEGPLPDFRISLFGFRPRERR